MRAVGLKVLKNKLSEYVRLAAAGETVLVTDRDRVVAELGPPVEGRRPPTLVSEGPPPRKPVSTLESVLKGLNRDRQDR